MEIDLNGKVGIITGGGSGIGRAACLVLASCGAKICAVDIDLARAEQTVAEIQANNGEALAVKANVSQGPDSQNMVRAAVERFGRLDFLYNNAGISPNGSITEISEADWDLCIAIDLRSVFLGSRYAIPELQKSGGGAIINTAGTLGLKPSPNKAAYATAKAGVINLTRSIALDYARDRIRCNAVCPGFVDTPLNLNTPQKQLDDFLHRYQPLPGVTKPEEIAALVAFLVSDMARMITGQAYVIDAGQQAGLF
jgi:NAD(P)-dependent dehydrogenase (short-subunit alcohol dehydrogenase family)